MLPKRTLIEIGDRVRELRKSKGLTQERFAEVMDLSENSISQIENGKKGMSQSIRHTNFSVFIISMEKMVCYVYAMSIRQPIFPLL